MRSLFVFILSFIVLFANAQYKWTKDGGGYYEDEQGGIVKYILPAMGKVDIADASQLTPKGTDKPLAIKDFSFSEDGKKILVYTNSKKVWRYETRGDYWILDLNNYELKKLGAKLPESSLMFAKLSPDGNKAAYVSKHNLYVEDLKTGVIKQLTKDGTDRLINGTFDWAYEEEFDLRDGFRWSPDSKNIAYWQIDARKIKNFYLINNTDSIYSQVIPIEYPKVGQDPSSAKIGVVNIATAVTKWMNIPGNPVQHYLTAMEWVNANELVIQQLNRKQNESKLMYAKVATGAATSFYTESDKAWIDIKSRWYDDPKGWFWMNNGKDFLWVSEKDGWRHIYSISRDGTKETLITKGDYDILTLKAIDEKNGYVYFMASPKNATQQYLYRTKLDGAGTLEEISPATQRGTHSYDITPNALYAEHRFSNAGTAPSAEWVSLPDHQVVVKGQTSNRPARHNVEMFQVTTEDGVTMDAWMIRPANFDSTKKYPVVFYVYAEPATQTVKDSYGSQNNFLYAGDMSEDGYVYISIDNRGTPAPKGAAWRKSIYQKIGILNVDDQAKAAKQVLKWPFIDTSRVAVWGWSGGASTTLNLLFRYPEIYKTGIAIAPVAYRLSYDNIYEERYMGLPQENMQAYLDASAITHVKGLKGKLLVVHGTGDDNVHYQNTELLINALVKNGKQFSMMAYPNRTHSISEGAETSDHLALLYTNFLRQNCPPGGR
jgi:dipeptidyl-peptidase 4